MTLILKPTGRGNWATVILQVSGRRAPPPLLVQVGNRMVLGGQQLRVVEVRP